jgi:hypothetical protein
MRPIAAPSGFAVGLGQSSELFALVVAGSVRPDEGSVDVYLNGVTHKADPLQFDR